MVERLEIDRLDRTVERVRPVPAQIGGHQSEGGEAARNRGNDDLRNAELLGERRGVHGARPAERHQAELARIVPAFDGHDAKRFRHAVVDDAYDARRRFHDLQPQWVRHVSAHRCFGRTRVDGEPPSEEMGTAQASEHHVRVGDRRAISAAAVAGGARFPRPRSAGRPEARRPGRSRRCFRLPR